MKQETLERLTNSYLACFEEETGIICNERQLLAVKAEIARLAEGRGSYEEIRDAFLRLTS